VLLAACGSDPAGPAGPGPDASVAADAAPASDAAASSDAPVATDACTGVDISAAPTYTQLFTNWFAAGTPGSCANGNCHGNTSNGGWKCGQTAATCFTGMTGKGFVNTTTPKNSSIISATNSPLRWFSPSGNMPQNNAVANADGKKAVLAWVCAGAKNN